MLRSHSMLDGPPPLLSVPSGEVARHALSGSIVPVAEILHSAVSPDLEVALGLIRSAFGESATFRVVVRPEMFTHGVTMAWLREQIGSQNTHLCLSDGQSVRLVPGMTTHVFFYGVGQADSVEGVLRLRRRAPELLAGLASQINTALTLVPGQPRRPRTIMLPPLVNGNPGLVLPFFAPRGPTERYLRDLAGREPENLPASQDFTYAAASEAALNSTPFAVGLINHIIQAYTRPDCLLVVGIPAAVELEDALTPLLTALRRHAFTLPSGLPPNVFLHVGGSGALPDAVFGGRSRLVAFEADTFWQRSPVFYAQFGTCTLLRERQSPFQKTGLGVTLQKLTGRVWAEEILPEAESMSLARYAW